MADDPKNLNEALNRINKLNQEVKKLGGEYFVDINKAVESFGGGLKGAQTVINNLGKDIDRLKDSFGTISTTLKNIVDDMGGMGKASKIINRGFDKLESSASRLQQHKNQDYILTIKQIKNEQKKQNLLVKELEYNLKRLGNSEEDQKIRTELTEQLKKEVGIIDHLNRKTQETLDTEIKIQKTLGLTGQAFKGIAKTLQNIGVESEAIDEINTSMRNAAEEGKTLKVVAEGLKGSFRAIKESLLTDPAVQLAFLTKTFKTLYDIGANFSKDTANLARELGMSSKNAAVLNREFYSLTLSSKSAFGNQQNFLEATLRLNESLGTSAIFSEEVLSTQAQISKVTGLTAEESADIYKLSLLNGKTQEEVYDSVGAIRKGNLNNKKVLQEVLKTSGQLAAQYKNNPILLGKAVVQAQKLGMTLEQTKNISSKLLNFEDSISAELEAELLTGQDLNLERARYLALMGDSAGAAEELMKNLGPNGLEKFQKMNVIQQEAYARALGMSADELADSLVKERQLQRLGAVQRNELNKRVEALKEAGEYEKAAELEKLGLAGKNLKLSEQQLDAQARIAQATDTFKSAIQAVIAGPLGKMADLVASTMETISRSPLAKAVLGEVGKIGGALALAGSIYLIGKTLISSFKGRPSGNPGDPLYTTSSGPSLPGTTPSQPLTPTASPTSGETLGEQVTDVVGDLVDGSEGSTGGEGKNTTKKGKKSRRKRRTPKAKKGIFGKLGKFGKGIFGKIGAKGLGKIIPGAGAIMALSDLAEGDYLGAGLNAAAGIASLFPGVGTAVAAGLTGLDMTRGIVGTLNASEDTELATGGIVTKPTRALVGEAGAEAVIPLDKLMAEFREMRAILTQIANREGNVYLDGTKVGKAMAMSTYKS